MNKRKIKFNIGDLIYVTCTDMDYIGVITRKHAARTVSLYKVHFCGEKAADDRWVPDHTVSLVQKLT